MRHPLLVSAQRLHLMPRIALSSKEMAPLPSCNVQHAAAASKAFPDVSHKRSWHQCPCFHRRMIHRCHQRAQNEVYLSTDTCATVKSNYAFLAPSTKRCERLNIGVAIAEQHLP